MLRVLAGFIAGVIALLVLLGVVRQAMLGKIMDDLSYRFDHYVFDVDRFPAGDFDLGRLVRRALAPANATVTFYNAQYEPVTHPDKPGRYGAVVRLNVSGKIAYRFITLYKTPGRAYWADTAWPITAQLPPNGGLDPAVVRNQGGQIAAKLQDGLIRNGDTSPELAVLLAGLSETPPGDPPAVNRTNADARDVAWWWGLQKKLGLETHYRNIIVLPDGYEVDPAKKWPLMLYLSAGQERGNDLALLRKGGLPMETDHGRKIPAIVAAPQCGLVEPWNPRALAQYIDELEAKYRIDPDRIYLLGGMEVWELSLNYPDRFAALVPIGGQNDPADAARLKQMPVWAFQGRNEDLHDTWRTTNMLDALAQAGGKSRLTLSDGQHDVWDQAFATDALYTWVFAQKRGEPEVVTPGIPDLYVPGTAGSNISR